MKVFVHVNVFTVQVCAFCALRSSDMQLFAYLMPRRTHQKLVTEIVTRNLHKKIWHNFTTVSCTKTTLWPVMLHGSC